MGYYLQPRCKQYFFYKNAKHRVNVTYNISNSV